MPLHQLLEPIQCFLGDPDSGFLNLEMCHLALTIAKKTLDENRFRNTQKTTDCPTPNFQGRERDYFKNNQTCKWDLKYRARYRIVCIECNVHYLHIENMTRGKTQSCNVKDVVHEPLVKLWAEQENL